MIHLPSTAMRRAMFPLGPWILAPALWLAPSLAPAQVTQAERDAMVYAHNVVRGAATPYPVPPLAAVSWNVVLEGTAQAWANLCMYGHTGTPGIGENIYAFASIPDPVPRPHPYAPLVAWESERAYYAYATNTCSPPPIPGTCGHYTQVVWRSSTSIGCGLQYCEINSPFGPTFPHWWFWVCQYSPAGNVNPAVNRPYLCDYDGNPGTPQTPCTAAPVGLYVDSFEVGTERWSGTSP
jgi:pathogenesis-related protein 1